MMSSCCTLRLKRRKAFSKDSDSWMMTSATLNSPPIRFGLVTCGVVVYGAPPMDIIACNRRYAHKHVDRIMGHLVVNSGIRCQVILVERGRRRLGNWRGVSGRYTYTELVKDSKCLIWLEFEAFWGFGGWAGGAIARLVAFGCGRERPVRVETVRGGQDMARQSKPRPLHPNLALHWAASRASVSTCLPASRVLPFAAVVLLE
jgi:hypothetical protein